MPVSPGRQQVTSSAASGTPAEAASAATPVVAAAADHTQRLHYSGGQRLFQCHLYDIQNTTPDSLVITAALIKTL